MIRIIFSIYVFIHGLAHVVGFVVPWRLMELEDAPYKTTIFRNIIDVGDAGIRIIGIIWLLTAFAFFYSGITIILDLSYWKFLTIVITMFSLVLCVLGLPDSKIGILANILILGFVLMNEKFGWLI